jgi:hypothetical protein
MYAISGRTKKDSDEEVLSAVHPRATPSGLRIKKAGVSKER